VTLNLKSARGKEVLHRLVASADVLVENFRPGVMARLGVSYDELKQINPKLVYCAISGFGQDGPMRAAPAYDQIIQGLSGIMSITGTPEAAPLRVGYPVADTLAGMMAAFAISSALVRRNATGEGGFIDVSMLDSALTAMGWVVSNYLIAGVQPRAHGNDNITAAPSGAFRTRDGLINIAANKQEQFVALVAMLGREDLSLDERFAQRENRKHNRAALTVELERELAKNDSAHWEAALNRIGVPAGAVLTVPQALALPQMQQREFLKTFDKVEGLDGPLTVSRTGFKLSGGDPDVHTPPPQLGDHTDEMLRSVGYSAQEIAGFHEDGTV
jgi:crotonobetainyl-CoA:carnitine CoA-transferase CaiB-like acyl-CoA transferase